MSENDDLAAFLRRLLAAFDRQAVDEMEAYVSDVADVPMDGRCVLFGYEGQVDAVWDVPEPRPERLRIPVPWSRRQLLRPEPDPMSPSIRIAEYRRVGDFTYERSA